MTASAHCPGCGFLFTTVSTVAWPSEMKCVCGSVMNVSVYFHCDGYSLRAVPSWG